MGKIILGTCVLLNARISQEQCGKNKQKDTFACQGCVTGLIDLQPADYQPEPTPIITTPKPAEVINTAEPKKKSAQYIGTCPGCQRPNMILLTAKGTCSRCWYRKKNGQELAGPRPNRGIRTPGKPPVSKPKPAPAPAATEPVLIPIVLETVEQTDSFTIALINAIDTAWAVSRAEWIAELSAISGAGSRLQLAAGMLDCISEMGY